LAAGYDNRGGAVELKYYWRVLVRRRNIIRNTFLIVAVIGLLSVAYSYYGASYMGHAQILIEVQPDHSVKNPIYDVTGAAQTNSDTTVQQLTKYAATTQYFKDVNTELGGKPNDWKAIQSATKIYPLTDSHDVFIEYDGANQSKVERTITAETSQLIQYIPAFQQSSGFPPINHRVTDPPTAQHVSLSSPLIQFLLRAALGLVAGIILAYLFEYLDDSIQDESDVRHWMNMPTLAVIPGGQPARRVRSA